MQSLASLLTRGSTRTFQHCLQIVWSQIPVDTDMLVTSIQTLVNHYEPIEVYFERNQTEYALMPTEAAKGYHVQTRHEGTLGHQTGQHWYIMMQDTTEDLIDYVTFEGRHGLIRAAVDVHILTLILMEEKLNVTTH